MRGVCAASTDISVHRLADLDIVRFRIARQQSRGIEHLTRCAEAALEAELIEEGLLNRVEAPVGGKAVDRRHGSTGDVASRGYARADGLAFDEHGARAADALETAVLRAGQTKRITQRGEQRVTGRSSVELVRLTINGQPQLRRRARAGLAHVHPERLARKRVSPHRSLGGGAARS
jgi:hypothetical protein